MLLALLLLAATQAAGDDVRALRLEVEAARSKGFYYLVDVDHSIVTLKLGGIALESYHAEAIDAGIPVLEGSRSPQLLRLHKCRSTAERMPSVIAPGIRLPAQPGPIPSRLELRCGRSLTMVFVSATSGTALSDHFRLPGDPLVALRVRVVLPDEEARKLIASMSETALVVFSFHPKQ